MKKIFAVIIAAMLAMSLCACGGNKETETTTETLAETTVAETTAEAVAPETVGVANPMVEVKSVDELNAAVGCKLAAVEGATAETFFVIGGDLAQYTFTLNKAEFTLRAAQEGGDISGVYDTEGGSLGHNVSDGEPVAPTPTSLGGYWARGFEGDMQYCLYSADATSDEFLSAYAKISGLVAEVMGGDDVENDTDAIVDEADISEAKEDSVTPTIKEEADNSGLGD